MSRLRLDKFLADMGYGTRQEVKELIRKGRVTVEGQKPSGPNQKVETDEDHIRVDGQLISYVPFEYWMLNKPGGVVSATEDKREKTVLELLPETSGKGLFPVGRLDKDTEGLLLLTNDGALSHRLLSPRSHVDKVYEALVEGRVTDQDVQSFREGLDIGDEKLTLPADMVILSVWEEKGAWKSRIRITIQEGRYHQIKRMFRVVGKQVLFLKRISMGPLLLDETLLPGQARKLTESELLAICNGGNREISVLPETGGWNEKERG